MPSFDVFMRCIVKNKAKNLAVSAVIAAIYVVLCHFQNILIPGSASFAIQFRAAEALMILAFFTPAAIAGLAVGCLLFNLSFAGALPLDFLVGTLATALAAGLMYVLRRRTVRGYPLAWMLMPALTNALLVGWELNVYIGGGFWLNAIYVAVGEAVVLLSLGSLLYWAIRRRNLQNKLFG